MAQSGACCRDRPDGSAYVVFVNREDALSAIKRYNNVALDGKPMQIELGRSSAGSSIALSSGLRYLLLAAPAQTQQASREYAADS